MLTIDNSFFLLVDMQGKLAQMMHKRKDLFENTGKLIQGLRILEIPFVWMEQYPKGLGETVPEIKQHLDGLTPHEKISFGCGGDEAIMSAINELGRKQAIVAGIEAHVCVYQSCRQLLEAGFEVTLLADCTSSRKKADKKIALCALENEGVKLACVEMTLFELMHKAGGDKFKQISKLVK